MGIMAMHLHTGSKSGFAISQKDAPSGYRIFWKEDESYSLDIYLTVRDALRAAGTEDRNRIRIDPVWPDHDIGCPWY